MRELLLSSDAFYLVYSAFALFGLLSAAALGYLSVKVKEWKAQEGAAATAAR